MIQIRAFNGTSTFSQISSYTPTLTLTAEGVVGSLDFTTLNSFATVPGEGLISLVFDLTPAVKFLHFPDPVVVVDVPHHALAPLTQVGIDDFELRLNEGSGSSERVVYFEIFGPDGKVEKQIELKESDLDDLIESLRKNATSDRKLPDGKYRVQLQEPGETRQRLVLEFEIFNGSIDDGTGPNRDRPPTSIPSTNAGPESNSDDVEGNSNEPIEPDHVNQTRLNLELPQHQQVFFDTDHRFDSDPRGASQFSLGATGETGDSFVVSRIRREWNRTIQTSVINVANHVDGGTSDTVTANDHTQALNSEPMNEFASEDSTSMISGVTSFGVGVVGMISSVRSVNDNSAAAGPMTRAARLIRKWLAPRGVLR